MPRLLALLPPALLLVLAAVVHMAARSVSSRADAADAELAAARDAAREQLGAVAAPQSRRDHLARLRAESVARVDKTRHLRLHPTEGWGELREGAYPLRRFELSVGPVPVPGGSVQTPLLASLTPMLPLQSPTPGVWAVGGVWGAHAPASLFVGSAGTDAPWPDGPPEHVWDALLFGDTLVYSATPPIPAIAGPALPGTLRMNEMDLAAILPNLPTGAAVYVW